MFFLAIVLAIVLSMILKNEGSAFKNKFHKAILFIILKGKELVHTNKLPKANIEELWGGDDRRQEPRFVKSLEVLYSIVKNNTVKNATGKTINISESGAKLLLDEKLPLNTSLNLKISIFDSDKIAEVSAAVVWTEDAIDIKDSTGKRFFYSGIKFSSIKGPSDNNLTDYIRSLTKSQKS